jgi:hypothetical protein
MASKNSKTSISDMLTKRTGAITTYLTDPNVTIPIAGKQCHPQDVLAIFQADQTARAGLDNAHASVTSFIAACKTADANRRAADAALKSYVVQLYGATSVQAQAFGYPAPKPAVKSVATKQAAIEKSAATRAVRGTKGSAQRAELTGTTEVYATPEAAAAAASQAVAPAAGAPVTPAGTPAPTTPGGANGAGGAAH